MLRRSKRTEMKENVLSGAELAAALAGDKKFRKQLLDGIGHAELARRRATDRIGIVATGRRLAADEELRRELAVAAANLRHAWSRLEKKRSTRGRKALFALVGVSGAAVAILPHSRHWLAERFSGVRDVAPTPRAVDEAIEVDVPVTTAYNQWTQFEEFPSFMEGVQQVRQLDDTRLHWVAKIGGHEAEWDAKILEQDPDRQISWISEDGKKTRGTVSFEPLGPARTLVRLSMSYQAEGVRETIGSAVGFDRRRIKGDLERFKELMESRGAESGGWRGTVSAGTAT